MTLSLSPPCCCGCTIYQDTFNAALNTFRYSFTPGDWSTSGGALVSGANDSPIIIYSVAGRFVNIALSLIALPVSGDWLEVRFGAHAWRFERSGSTFTESFDGNTIRTGTYAGPVSSAFMNLYSQSLYPDYFLNRYPNPSTDIAQFVANEKEFGLDLASGFSNFSIAASSGPSLGTLTLTRAKPGCASPRNTCQYSCWPQGPTSIDLDFSGFPVDTIGVPPCPIDWWNRTIGTYTSSNPCEFTYRIAPTDWPYDGYGIARVRSTQMLFTLYIGQTQLDDATQTRKLQLKLSGPFWLKLGATDVWSTFASEEFDAEDWCGSSTPITLYPVAFPWNFGDAVDTAATRDASLIRTDGWGCNPPDVPDGGPLAPSPIVVTATPNF